MGIGAGMGAPVGAGVGVSREVGVGAGVRVGLGVKVGWGVKVGSSVFNSIVGGWSPTIGGSVVDKVENIPGGAVGDGTGSAAEPPQASTARRASALTVNCRKARIIPDRPLR